MGMLTRISETKAKLDTTAKRKTLEQRLRLISQGYKLGAVGAVHLWHDRVVFDNHPPVKVMLTPDTAAFVDSAGAISSRVTATRLVGLGLFALAAPKKSDGRELFFYVDDPAGVAMGVVPPSQQLAARQLAVTLVNAARNVDAANAKLAAERAEIETQIAALDS